MFALPWLSHTMLKTPACDTVTREHFLLNMTPAYHIMAQTAIRDGLMAELKCVPNLIPTAGINYFQTYYRMAFPIKTMCGMQNYILVI